VIHCPECSRAISFAGIDPAPSEGDFTVCPHCAELLTFTVMGCERIPPAAWRQLSENRQQILVWLQLVIRSHNRMAAATQN
jgi:hypothetical protein